MTLRGRRFVGGVAQAGALVSAGMLVLSIVAIVSTSVRSAAAAILAGSAETITPQDGSAGAGTPLNAGGSATPFSLKLPTGAACSGDSANDSYLWHTYMVPSSVDPATLTFDSNGPIPPGSGAAFRNPFYDTFNSPVVNQITAPASPPPGPGPIVNVPAMTVGAVWAPGDIAAGAYNIGIACTRPGPPSATQVDKYWNGLLTIATVPADLPAGITWTFEAGSASTTSSTSSSTSTTTGSVSTTSTTATSDSTTSTTAASGSTSSTTAATGFGLGSGSGSAPSGRLPATGGSPLPLVLWGSLLLVFGRMAVLLGRTPEVREVVVG